MKTIVVLILVFMSLGIKAQEEPKKKGAPPNQERSINEPGIKPKKKAASKSRSSDAPPPPASAPGAPPPPAKKDTLKKPE